MTNDRALTLVRQDMAAGRQNAAIRRLRAMLASDPGDAVAYRLLTEIHRAAGDLAEAGRWGYLTGDATPEEVEAFECAHPQPWVRIRLLGKSLDPNRLPDATARARLASLHQQVTEATIPLQHSRGGGTRPATSTQPATSTSPYQSARVPAQRGSQGEQPWTASRGAGRQPTEAAASGSRRFPRWSPTRAVAALRDKLLAAGAWNYLLLALLIVGGVAGSLIAVAGVRAIFGVKHWFAPVQAILEAIGRLFQG